jgi:hypothetical protein
MELLVGYTWQGGAAGWTPEMKMELFCFLGAVLLLALPLTTYCQLF